MIVSLRSERDGPVLRLTLDDPSTRNSLSDRMMSALQSELDQASEDKSIGAIIIAATGPVLFGPQPEGTDGSQTRC